MILFTRLKHKILEKNITNLQIAFSSQKPIINTGRAQPGAPCFISYKTKGLVLLLSLRHGVGCAKAKESHHATAERGRLISF